MHDHLIHLGFSERVALANASAELARHRTTLREQAALLRQSGRKSEQRTGVIADLRALKEVDTSALGVILHLDREVRAQFKQPMRIQGAPANLLSLARLSSLADVLCWEDAATHEPRSVPGNRELRCPCRPGRSYF